MNRLALSWLAAFACSLVAEGALADETREEQPKEQTAAPAPATTPPAHPKNVVTLNVPSNVFGAYSIEYQRVLGDKLALVVEPTLFNLPPIPDMNLGIFGPGVVVGVAVHPFGATGHAPDGFFVIGEGYVTFLDSAGDADGFALGGGAGAVAGWTFRWWEHFVLSLGLGGTANGFGYNLSGSPGVGFTPVLRLNVGAAF